MGVKITSTGAHSLNLLVGSVYYRVRWGEWTEVHEPDHLRWFLAPTPNGAIVREEKELSPYYVRVMDEPQTIKCYFDRQKQSVALRPDKWTTVDRLTAFNLRRHPSVILMTPKEMLDKAPDAPILIKRDEGLGDLIFLTAAVRALRREHPEANLTLATKQRYVEMMRDTGLFNNVTDFEGCYDMAPFLMTADLANWVETHPQQHTIIRAEVFANGLGLSCKGDYRGVFNHNYVLKEGLIPDGDKIVAVDLSGSVWMRRPSKDYCRKLIQGLDAAGFIPVGVHWNACPWWPDGVGVDLNGCSWEDYIAILDRCSVLSVDTGTLHIANAMQRPTVGLFGPIPDYLRVQNQEKCVTINSPAQCRFCTMDRRPCPHNERAARCFDEIPVNEIISALEEVEKWH